MSIPNFRQHSPTTHRRVCTDENVSVFSVSHNGEDLTRRVEVQLATRLVWATRPAESQRAGGEAAPTIATVGRPPPSSRWLGRDPHRRASTAAGGGGSGRRRRSTQATASTVLPRPWGRELEEGDPNHRWHSNPTIACLAPGEATNTSRKELSQSRHDVECAKLPKEVTPLCWYFLALPTSKPVTLPGNHRNSGNHQNPDKPWQTRKTNRPPA